ncbi:MAG: type I glyceraldehyde-3-phosphate dehydrogenase [Deltaproteobacteria bacterium]|nr:MAG: type I glyceraldehyde-3-phosphate dehydrogenase [Deltaproteobacteria bacterium]
MGAKIGINGFGRIGRVIVRAAQQMGADMDFVAVNDLTDAQTLAHLLKYDSVHGPFPGEVQAKGDAILANGKEIAVMALKDPAQLPWKDLGVEIVMECTGLFRERDRAAKHLEAGAKKVIISAPAKGPDMTIVMGVNHKDYDPNKHHIISNASCTTNCLAPVAKVILENFGIKEGLMTTIHAYTNDQRILDLPHKDLRRARAGAVSMIPTTTGAATAVSLVLPQLKGKLDGMAIRVPTPNVSLVDLVAEVEKDTSVEGVNTALQRASEGELENILGYTEEPLVSVDFNGTLLSSIVDGLSTTVIGRRMAKVLAWYDNEMGYSARMVDLANFIASER